jgi:Sec7-like guanine-nucleotide exchange factor
MAEGHAVICCLNQYIDLYDAQRLDLVSSLRSEEKVSFDG